MSADDSQLPPIVTREKLNPFNYSANTSRIITLPSTDEVQIMGVKFSAEAAFQLFKDFNNDEQRVLDHVRHTQALLDQQGRRRDNPNDYLINRSRGAAFDTLRGWHATAPGDRYEMFRRRLRPGEQIIIEDMARELRQTYEPFHTGSPMVAWDEMGEPQRVKWLEMAMAAVQYLDRRGAFR